jgi:pre-mRNA-processing factor SLU7
VPKELLGGQTEDYVEYSRTGQVVKGRERAKARSKYDEDGAWSAVVRLAIGYLHSVRVLAFPGNHTSVWGSFYSTATGQWGFACCHSSIKNSYCAGKASIEAAQAEARGGLGMLTTGAGEDAAAAGQDQNKSMMQLKMEKDREEKERNAAAAKGKRKADAQDGEGEGRNKAAPETEKRAGFGGVTEEEMGKSIRL